MIDWVAVLSRILTLYNVKTQGELGMALGAPVNLGMDAMADNNGIPWLILEMVVAEKKVSWDWLLTGRAATDAEPPKPLGRQPVATTDATAPGLTEKESLPPPPRATVPRYETRELARQLLDQPRCAAGAAAAAGRD